MNFNFDNGLGPQVGGFGPGGFNPQSPPFRPSGRQGLGGSQVPLPADRFGSAVITAQNLAPRYAGAANGPETLSPQARAAMLMGPGGQGRVQDQNFAPSMEAASRQVADFTNGGVRPGAVPQMNAVEAARQAGPGPDVKGAALKGYR